MRKGKGKHKKVKKEYNLLDINREGCATHVFRIQLRLVQRDNSRCVQYRLPIRNATYSIMTINVKRGKQPSRLMPILSGGKRDDMQCMSHMHYRPALSVGVWRTRQMLGLKFLISEGKAENRRLPSNDVLPRNKNRSGTVAFVYHSLSPRESRG